MSKNLDELAERILVSLEKAYWPAVFKIDYSPELRWAIKAELGCEDSRKQLDEHYADIAAWNKESGDQ